MKSTLHCPKCNGRRILRVNEVLDKAPGEEGSVLSIRASIKGDGLGEWENIGVFQAYVCARCGYTEWFVADPGALPVDGVIVEELESPEHAGPYR